LVFDAPWEDDIKGTLFNFVPFKTSRNFSQTSNGSPVTSEIFSSPTNLSIPKEILDLINERCKLIIEELTGEVEIEKIVFRSYIQGMLDTVFCKETLQRICKESIRKNGE
jgi:hypothetical protein